MRRGWYNLEGGSDAFALAEHIVKISQIGLLRCMGYCEYSRFRRDCVLGYLMMGYCGLYFYALWMSRLASGLALAIYFGQPWSVLNLHR